MLTLTSQKSVIVKLASTFMLVAALILITQFTTNLASVHAATTWTVTTIADDAAGGACTTICTLRDAVNSAVNGDTIQFQSGLTGTITLGSAGSLFITTSVTINGPGALTLAIDGNNAVNVFLISSGITVSISGLTIQHGNAASYGGGIENGGTLTVSNCTFSNNAATASGGAISNNGTLTVNNSTFLMNSSTSLGGGIFNLGGTATLNSNNFSGNSSLNGGAIDNSATLTANSNTFLNNSAYNGGAVYNFGGTSTFSASTFFSNTANNSGGAIDNNAMLSVSNSTLYGNSSTGNGGGIVNSSGALTLSNSTVFGNSANGNGGGIFNAATLNLLSDIVAKNTAVALGPDLTEQSGTVTSLGYNLIGDGTSSGVPAVTGDQIGTSAAPIDPLLGTLNNNGGSTQSMPVPINSPAYQTGFCGGNNTAVPVALAVTQDQRGQARKGLSTGCDVGAFEETFAFAPASPLLNGVVGNNYPSQPISAVGGLTPYLYSQLNGTLPSGLSFNGNSLSGIPTAAGVYHFTLKAQAANGIVGTIYYTLSITNPTPTPTNTPLYTPTITPTATSTPVPPAIDTIGIYRSGTFYLRLHNNTGNADLTVSFTGGTKIYPIIGDWTGAGVDTVGIYDQRSGQFTLCVVNDSVGCTLSANKKTLVLGVPNDTPLSGRWQLSATNAGVGVFRPSNGLLYLKNALTTGYADYTMVLGVPGDVGLAGDWNHKGFDSPGVYRPSNSTFYLSNQVKNGSVTGDYQAAYGLGGDAPVAGDWIAQGHDGIGLFRQSNGFTYLKDQLVTGYADITFTYGIPGDIPVAGHWQGVYPPVPHKSSVNVTAPPVLITRTAVPLPSNGSVEGSNQIGG